MKIKTKLTPVRMPGGKSNALKFLDSRLPKNFKIYKEPFFGGGSVGLFLMQTCKDASYHINDLFYPLYCFWTTLYNNPNEMIQFLLKEKNRFHNKEDARELHLSCKDMILRTMEDKDVFYTACLWYILNKTSFSGMAMIGSYASLAWDQNFTVNCINNLIKTHDLMHSVKEIKITNLDYSELLGNDGEDVFIFLDPPYDIKCNLYGNNGNMHKGFNHEKFVEYIKKCKHKWMITYNDNDIIQQWFDGYNKHSWDLNYTMKSAERADEDKAEIQKEDTVPRMSTKTGKKGKELLIWN